MYLFKASFNACKIIKQTPIVDYIQKNIKLRILIVTVNSVKFFTHFIKICKIIYSEQKYINLPLTLKIPQNDKTNPKLYK